MDCKSEAASHYAGCDCNEAHWQNEIARLTRERDEAMERERLARLVAEQQQERAAGLSRELLDAMQARDSYRMSAELRVGMRREFEALLGVGDTMDTGTFEAGLARLRALLAAETRVEEMFADREASAVAWNRICGNMKWRAEHAEKERSAAVQRALAAESRAARLEFQIEREIIFLEEEAATGVSFYEATFTNRAQELRAVIAAEEDRRAAARARVRAAEREERGKEKGNG